MTANQLTAPAPTSLVLRRTFEAPCERVFRAWLSPDIMRRFLDGDRHEILDVTADARVGGSYSITWKGDDGPMTVRGVYRELVPNERIVCTWTWEEDDPGDVCETLLTLEFHAAGDRTELVLTHVNFRSETSRDNHAEGWQSIFDKFAALGIGR